MDRPTLQPFNVEEEISKPVPKGQPKTKVWVALEKSRGRAVQTVRNLVERALLILQTQDGKDALVTHAGNIVKALIQEKQRHLYPGNDLKTFSKMPDYINDFLESLWKHFPDVFIEDDGRDDAWFKRYDWAREAQVTTLETGSKKFVASKSGELYLAQSVSPIFTQPPPPCHHLPTC
jgi:hypothetical protein